MTELRNATIMKLRGCKMQSRKANMQQGGIEMSEKEKKSREMLEQLEKLPPKTQERIGYMIEGALVLAESRDDRPTTPEKST